MVLYCPHITPRLEYIIGFLSDEMGISIELTTDKARFCSLTIPKINYSVERLTPTELFVEPAQLLFEKKIRIQDITCFQYNARPAFFKSEESDFPFDIFSATFYLLSRYEEYLPHSKNSYGAYAHGFCRPLISRRSNRWPLKQI